MVKVPFIDVAALGVNAPDIVTLLKETGPVTLAVPAKITAVFAPAVNVPLFAILPPAAIVKDSEPPMVSDAPLFMVMLLATPSTPVLKFGKFGAPELITTLVDEVGIPPHQFEAVFQSVLVVPRHVPVLSKFTVTAKRVVLSHPLVVCVE
jgi:hypothetical protein